LFDDVGRKDDARIERVCRHALDRLLHIDEQLKLVQLSAALKQLGGRSWRDNLLGKLELRQLKLVLELGDALLLLCVLVLSCKRSQRVSLVAVRNCAFGIC
jgi:hypothetical protein